MYLNKSKIEESLELRMLDLAKEVSKYVHLGQVDKAGKDYYLHPEAVAKLVDFNVEKTVAYLHDVIEDSNTSLKDLEAEGFSAEILAAVDAITKRTGESYESYLNRVAVNEIAYKVKLADMQHNSDSSRFDFVTESTIKNSEKYRNRMEWLKSIHNKIVSERNIPKL